MRGGGGGIMRLGGGAGRGGGVLREAVGCGASMVAARVAERDRGPVLAAVPAVAAAVVALPLFVVRPGAVDGALVAAVAEPFVVVAAAALGRDALARAAPGRAALVVAARPPPPPPRLLARAAPGRALLAGAFFAAGFSDDFFAPAAAAAVFLGDCLATGDPSLQQVPIPLTPAHAGRESSV